MKVSKVVGRYWARMAYVDIGHAQGQKLFMGMRGRLDYANLDSAGSGSYKVKSARSPKYMGANTVPLKGTGAISVSIKAGGPFTATLAIRNRLKPSNTLTSTQKPAKQLWRSVKKPLWWLLTRRILSSCTMASKSPERKWRKGSILRYR